MLRKAAAGSADVVVFDLEDGVPPEATEDAREAIVEVLGEADPDAEVCVRVNPGKRGDGDLEALAAGEHTPDALMVPKVDGPATIERADAAVRTTLGRSLPVFALIERARGVAAAVEIARADATDLLVYGGEDLAADVGAQPTPGGRELEYARQRVVLAAAVGGIQAIDTVHPDIEDREGLRASAERARRLGYAGKLAIHPAQVEAIADAFTPDADAVARAKRIVAAPEADGGGAFRVGDEMVDAPVLAQARRTLERAGISPDAID